MMEEKREYTGHSRAGILGQSMGARNREETELSYRPASLCGKTGRYDNPISTRLLTPTGCSKILAPRIPHLWSLVLYY
jgi:hypothetical protein